jgi:acetyl esterase/lipase
VLFVHGGAYVGQISPLQYRWCADLARRTGAVVVVPVYPLAPFGTAASVVPAVADLITDTIAKYGTEAVALAGDSAGGGLALAAVQKLVTRQAPVPSRLVLMSPWLDVTISDPDSERIADPLLGVVGLRACGRLWAGDLDAADPMVSPLFGSLAGLPPTLVVAGTLDLISPDSARLQHQAQDQNADVAVQLMRGLVHVWPLFPFLPEARALRPKLYRALTGPLGSGVN